MFVPHSSGLTQASGHCTRHRGEAPTAGPWGNLAVRGVAWCTNLSGHNGGPWLVLRKLGFQKGSFRVDGPRGLLGVAGRWEHLSPSSGPPQW